VLEFAPGDLIDLQQTTTISDLGRGLLVFNRGLAFGFDYRSHSHFVSTLLTSRSVFGDAKVLLEDGHPATKGRLKCLTLTQVIFIPRETILGVLDKNARAWKESARWAYIRLILLSEAASRKIGKQPRQVQGPPIQDFQQEHENVKEILASGGYSEKLTFFNTGFIA